MYKVTLVSGKNDIEFIFSDWDDVDLFTRMSLNTHSPREVSDGAYEKLVIEVEAEKVADGSDF